SLPWRGVRDPYRVWVSEIMLQQTQVETVIPYYRRWLRRFPTIRALASASLDDVLAEWEGLGYYSRARNLHRAAQKVMAEFGGRVPRDVKSLQSLPGIGRYTAGAIDSIAFGADAAALDGNVKRVLARVLDYREDAKSAKGERELWEIAERILPRGKAGDFNQAMMDLGATICAPKAPDCARCPLCGLCAAQKLGVQEKRPVVKKKAPTPHYTVTAGIVRKNGRVLIAQRPADKLLGGLWEFPGGKCEAGESLAECLRRELREELGIEVAVGGQMQTLRHGYTHFKITLHVFECKWRRGNARALEVAAYQWVRPGKLNKYAMGKTDRQIAEWIIANSKSQIQKSKTQIANP
ncbi:MAG: A/G-specific adenine glycosylase, partial [Chloroflexi bacterium]|nr:A/G-specific adenine glycosylase [Chloroflexota bacterium]